MITRNIIKKAREKSKKFFTKLQKLGNKSSIYQASKYILRNCKFTINYNKLFKCLNNIDFIDAKNKSYVEVDKLYHIKNIVEKNVISSVPLVMKGREFYVLYLQRG